jgi:hypothetical protein
MNDLKYSIALPENQKDSYGEFDTVDFKLSYINRKLIGGSIRLLADVQVSANTSLTETIAYDGFVGGHSFVDTISTSIQNAGQVENIRFYSRYISSKAKASLTKDDLFSSAYVCEGRCPSDKMASSMLKGMVAIGKDTAFVPLPSPTTASTFSKPLDLAVKLDFCLNNMIGDPMLPYAKTGDIYVSLTLPRNVEVLYGSEDIGGTKNYSLSNLRIAYITVADDGKYSPKYNMRIRSDLKNTINSTFANISTKVPIVADAFFATFIETDKENNVQYNSLANERLPLVSRLEFLWNDSFSQEYTYELDNEEEILTNYIKAVSKVVGNNNANTNVLASNDGWGIGLSFGQFVDLSKSKIGINIRSAVDSTNPYTCYLFFSGVTSI